MTTLLVSGGVLVDELSVRPMDVLIQNGRVQAIVPPGHGRAADSVIDARGLHVATRSSERRSAARWRSQWCAGPWCGETAPPVSSRASADW